MRKLKILILIFVLMLAFSACTATTFNGSRTGNESQLIMDYEVLNMTESQILELETGDTVEFVIVSEGGKVDITLQKDGESPVYEGVDVPTRSFSVNISESGSYKVTVTGKNAKGNVSIIKKSND